MSGNPDTIDTNVTVGTDLIITKNVIDLNITGAPTTTGTYLGTISYNGTALQDDAGIITPMHSKEFTITIS